MATKFDINPATGKAYGVNPTTGVQDDNYWATVAEPQLKTQTATPVAPSSSSTQQISSATGQMPSKGDINPATGKAYAINPDTGVWDDNYWANTVGPQFKAQYGGEAGGLTMTQPAPIDLNQIHQGLYNSSGISDAERELSDKTNVYNEQISRIKDNPYLSEATMTGRISKLTDKFNADKANSQNDIAMRKADVETQLNLQLKQFDINSQAAQQSFQQFQALLEAGALDNASGQDIANLTRSTGLSSSMIQSAIGVSKAKNAPKAEKANTSVIQFDDGNNTGFAVVNTDTGEIINKQIVAASKPSATEEKLAAGGGTTKQSASATKAQALQVAKKGANAGVTLGTMMNELQQYGMTKQQIYDAYMAANYYKPTAAQIKADKKKYGVK